MFRDDLGAYLGGRHDRRKAMRDILKMEEAQHLGGGRSLLHDSASQNGSSSSFDHTNSNSFGAVGGSGALRPAGSATLKSLTAAHSQQVSLSAARNRSPEKLRAVCDAQQKYMERLARPVSPPAAVFTDFIRAPRSIQGAGLARSQDVLFEPDENGNFWLYGAQKVTQSTIGNIAPNTVPTEEDVRKLPICAAVRKRIDALMALAATRSRCGIIFDIVSTSRVIAGGIPRLVGSYVYEYIDQAHYDVVGLKFVFVGITDNVNCCAARDVFCRDDRLNGKYIGGTKRPFDALDNVHMFTVQPTHRLHPFATGGGGGGGGGDRGGGTGGCGDAQNLSIVEGGGGDVKLYPNVSASFVSMGSADGTPVKSGGGGKGGDAHPPHGEGSSKTFVTQQH